MGFKMNMSSMTTLLITLVVVIVSLSLPPVTSAGYGYSSPPPPPPKKSPPPPPERSTPNSGQCVVLTGPTRHQSLAWRSTGKTPQDRPTIGFAAHNLGPWVKPGRTPFAKTKIIALCNWKLPPHGFELETSRRKTPSSNQ
ncbi:hypothetical protein E3N88_26434 [Mikania micrantha]|uniref:Uncharacterized protein n=1 Tax=Mikania micrantha TaxID=192012 RepID=A0A5N6N7J7_9ASTR|nr:hypothetical protein E3N88_26434 [Mikania micrantha]